MRSWKWGFGFTVGNWHVCFRIPKTVLYVAESFETGQWGKCDVGFFLFFGVAHYSGSVEWA